MRSSTISSAYRSGAQAADHEQPGLFIEHLAADDPPTIDHKRDDDARARRVRHRPPNACRETTAGVPLQVPIDQLDDDPLHPREGYPQECLDDLAKDIAERGVLQAIVVAPADVHGRYRIRFGVQRWRAAGLAGLTEVPIAVRAQPCEVYDQMAENLKRHGLAPLELARFIRSRVEAGESNLQIARKLAVDPTTVTHHLTLLELPPVLDEALESGRCTAPRTLHELQRLHVQQPDAVAALLKGDLPVTRGAVAALRRSAAASGVPSEHERAAPLDPITDLIGRTQTLCDRLDRLLSRLVDAGPGALCGEQLAALRERLAALVQRLGG